MIPTATKLIFAAFVLASASAFAQDNKAAAGAKEEIHDFYGVPLDLTLWGLKKLKYTSEIGWKMGEGEVYSTAKIIISRKVTLDASFGRDGDLYMLETSSRGAIGPRRISVGSSLADVRQAWPFGKLLWGIEDGQFVTFDTGARIYYQFSPKALPPEAWARPRKDVVIDPAIKVITIRVAALDKEQ